MRKLFDMLMYANPMFWVFLAGVVASVVGAILLAR